MPRPLATLAAIPSRAVLLLLFLASTVQAQTGAHGYVVGGVAVAGCVGGCPSTGPVHDQLGLIGGGFAYPLRKGRAWIAGDVTSRVSNGYFDASGGPTVVVALGSLKAHHLEPFAQGGPRWGDGGNVRWNVGGGTNVWMKTHVGLRLEYQYQWENTTFVSQTFGPSGPIGPPTRSDVTLDEHLLRVGIAIR